MMTATERRPRDGQAALAIGNGVRTPYERDQSIDAIFTKIAQAVPYSSAIVGSDCGFTYSEVERGSNRVAHALQSLGVKPGSAVGVAFERSSKLPLVLLGILKAGAAYVPLDPSYPRERLAWMIDDSAVSLVVTDGPHELPEIPARRIHAGLLLAGVNEERPDVTSGPSSLAYIMYTSGSTGRPKGVGVEHRGVARLVRGLDYVALGPNDTFLHFAPLSFDASTFEIWAPLLNAARLAVPRPGLLAMDELADTLDRFGVTTMFLTTALFQRLVDTPSARPRTLRTLLTGGEVASPTHMARFLQAFPRCRLVAVYGPTENTTFSTWCNISPADVLGSSVPIGKPIANSTAFVLDTELKPLPVGVEGELYLGGDGVARGYVNRPDLTAERFVSDPFTADPSARLYRSGDRARWRPDGLLEFLGRDDDQVKVRGFRIELGEIESALQRHEAVGDVAVVVVERGGEKELVAHVVLGRDSCADEHELRTWLSRALPSYMIPHRIVVRGELPLTPSGKIDRVALTRGGAVAVGRASHPRCAVNANATELERAIAEIWQEVLRGDVAPGSDENFFDAGGDSLRLLAIHSRLREHFGVDVSVTDLFEHSTIRRLAAFIGLSQGRA
jgi:amino acid adenylation domain-containing protein